ncbi:MAG: type II toxin-antitoxin system prevent-host-death family antitoxin [Acidimicrobiia bacterium]
MAATGETIIVTKRGRPVAKVVPVEPPAPLLGSVSYDTEADLVEPLAQPWGAET